MAKKPGNSGGGGGKNQEPEFTQLTFSIDENNDSATFLLAGADYVIDPNDDALTYEIVGGADAALFQIDPLTGEVTFIDSFNLDYETKSSYEIIIAASDKKLTTTATVTININDLNEVPIAYADTGAGTENETLTLDVLANDWDQDVGDDPSTFVLNSAVISSVTGLSVATGGTLSIVNNQLVFDPGSDFDELALGEIATVLVTYEMADDEGLVSTSTATITVTGTNDAPMLSGDISGDVVEDGAQTVNGALIVADLDLTDSHSWSISGSGAGAYGALSIDQSGNWGYALENTSVQFLAADEVVTETFTITVDDGHGGSDTQDVTITITGTNDAPVISGSTSGAVPAVAGGTGGSPIVTDPDVLDSHTWSLVGDTGGAGQVDTTYGTAYIYPAGNWGYLVDDTRQEIIALAEGETTTDSFDIMVDDGHGGTDTQTITITILGTNDTPIATDNSQLAVLGAANTEFLVNTSTTLSQNYSSVAALSDGRFVVTWQDYSRSGDDTSSFAIRGQVFDAEGNPQLNTNGNPAEFVVNSTTTGAQTAPDVSGIEGGGFVVTWTDSSLSADDPSITAVRGQVFGANGEALGSEFLVNTTTSGPQGSATVSGLEGGGFVITWQDNSQTGGDTVWAAVRGQVFNADGSPILDANGNPAEFLVNTTTNFDQRTPSVDGLEGGGFVVTWLDSSATGDDTSGYAIRGQMFNADGSPVLDGNGDQAEFLVNSTVNGNQDQPSVSALEGGGFVVTWRDASDTSSWGVRGQVFDVNGNPSGAEFLINSTITGYQGDPSVSALAGGGFVVSWQDNSQTGDDTSSWAVRGQIYDASGNPFVDANGDPVEFVVNTTIDQGQYHPSVAGLAGGGFVVTWTDGSHTSADTSDWAVRGQVFDASGNKLGSVPTASGNMISDDDGVGIDSDIDGDELTISAVTGGDQYGTLTWNADGSYSYVGDLNLMSALAQGETADEIYTYTIDDGNGGTDSATLTVTVTGINDAPLVNFADQGGTLEDMDPAIWNLLDGVSDPDNGALLSVDVTSVVLLSGRSDGWTVTQTGEFTITTHGFNDLAEGEQEVIQISYDVVDQWGASVNQMFSFTVTGTNDAPWGSSSVSLTRGEDEGKIGMNILAYVYDPDGDSLSVDAASLTLVSGIDMGWGIDWSGTNMVMDPSDYNYLAEGETAETVYTVDVIDGHGGVFTKTMVLTVTGTNDGPVISGDISGDVVEDGAGISSGTLIVADPDTSDSHSWSITGDTDGNGIHAGTYGSLSLDQSGNWGYTLDDTLVATDGLAAGELVTDVFVVQADDGNAGADTQIITITITGTNDAPILSSSVSAQAAIAGDAYMLTLPSDVFVDHDGGGAVSYSATLADGSALPSWLSFNTTTGAFSGTPSVLDAGLIQITVTGTESDGLTRDYTFPITIIDGIIYVGTDGFDHETGSMNGDYMLGFGGNDRFFGGAGDDYLDGGDGRDRLLGEAGDDVLVGGAGDDHLNGGSGIDVITGGAGDDTMVLRDGETGEFADGGSGNDTLSFTASAGGHTVTVSGSDVLQDGVTIASSIERVYLFGGSGNDTLTGGAGVDYIVGGDGNDTLNGGGGADFLNGGSGIDVITGGAGDDTMVLRDGETGEFADGGSGNDTLSFTASAGGHTVTVSGSDVLQDGVIIASNIEKGYLYGGSGDDTLNGGDGADFLNGGSGIDVITGGAGNDRIYGGEGDDRLYGGSDNDTFVFNFNSGSDTIFDFKQGIAQDDVIDLTALGLTDVAGDGILNDLTITYDGSSTVIDLGGGDTITLLNYDMANLQEADFIF